MGVGRINTDYGGSPVRRERRRAWGGMAIRVASSYSMDIDLALVCPDCLRYADSVGWQMSWNPGGRVVH